jgi:hypothetical protein
MLGLFNNLGIEKTATDGEVADPAATQEVLVSGPCDGVEALVGGDYVLGRGAVEIRLRIPAGQVAVLSFPINP